MHRESDRHPPQEEDDPPKTERRDPELPADDEADVPPLGGGA